LKKETSTKIVLWTVGHSNCSIKYFLGLLKKHKIEVLVDVRSFPTSKIEHFKQEEMKCWLPENGIEYIWLGKELGGYRKGGYKEHMQTELFKEGIKRLLKIARKKRTCLMCMEANPKYCHRRYISTFLENKENAKVIHILKREQTSFLKVLRMPN